MSDNLETPSFGDFSIQNTMEMGMGNQELLKDLMSSETSTASPEDVTEIKEEAPKPSTKTSPKTTETDAPKKEESDASKSIQDFLLGETEEEDDEEDAPSTKSKTAPSNEESDNDDVDDVSNRFTALSNDLFKLGVFNKDEDEEDVRIESAEDFLERFNLEKKKGSIEIVQNFIGQFGEDYQQAFDAIFVKGVDPKEYFGVYNNIESFANLDLSEERNQEAVLKQALIDQGFEPEDVESEIERLKNYGDLETVAQKHHKVLVKKKQQSFKN